MRLEEVELENRSATQPSPKIVQFVTVFDPKYNDVRVFGLSLDSKVYEWDVDSGEWILNADKGVGNEDTSSSPE